MGAFDAVNISQADINKYLADVKAGHSMRAVTAFIGKYLKPTSGKYAEFLQKTMNKGQSLKSKKVVNNISISISSRTLNYKTAMQRLYSQFVTKVYAKGLFNVYSISNPSVKQSIIQESLAQFKDLTAGRLGSVSGRAITNFRKFQTGLLVNQKKIDSLRQMKVLDIEQLNKLSEKMRAGLIKQNPDFFKMVNGKQFVRYRDGSLHKIDDYVKMATEQTLLNADRQAVEVQQAIRGNRVVEYYQAVNKGVKEPRTICPRILAQKLFGKPLVALDETAAKTLGIPSLTEIKSTPDFAMGIGCRHSIRYAGKFVNQQVNKILYLSENEVV